MLPLLAISVAVLAAQEPVFRTGTRLVRLDVSVLDNKKQPVRDLTAADFRVTEGGRALRVRAFQMVEVPTVDDSPGPAVAGATPILGAATVASEDDPTDAIATNPGRLVVLVMDDGMTPTEPRWMRQAKSIARQVIEGMGPRDRVAMQFTRAGRTRLELTSDRPQLLRELETFDPGGFLALPPTKPNWEDEEPRYWRTLSTLRNTTEALATLTDRQKVIVYVRPGPPADRDGDLPRLMIDLFRTAERANVVIYTFDPTGLDTLEDYVSHEKYCSDHGLLRRRRTGGAQCRRWRTARVAGGMRWRARQQSSWPPSPRTRAAAR